MVGSFKLQDDGLYIEDVGKWAKQKYQHIGYYADLFSNGMKNKWDCLIYIDLFSGAGIARIKKSGKRIWWTQGKEVKLESVHKSRWIAIPVKDGMTAL